MFNHFGGGRDGLRDEQRGLGGRVVDNDDKFG